MNEAIAPETRRHLRSRCAFAVRKSSECAISFPIDEPHNWVRPATTLQETHLLSGCKSEP